MESPVSGISEDEKVTESEEEPVSEEENSKSSDSDVSGRVSRLSKTVRGMGDMLLALQESTNRILEAMGQKGPHTASKTSKKISNPKTKSDRETSSELHTLMQESGNFEEMNSPAIKNKFDTIPTDRQSRRESKLITSMRYNITRAEMSEVVNMKSAEPFTSRLNKLSPGTFLHWYTKWNEHMTRSRCYSDPTSLISDEIRETLMDNNDLTIEQFHELEPEDFIKIVAKEVKCRSKSHYAQVMLKCYGRMETLDFKGVLPNKHKAFYQGILKRRTYFFRVFEFLNFSNSVHIPLVKGDKGLAKLFMSTIDKEYCESVLLEVDPKKAYKSIKVFIETFMAIAKSHYLLAEAACAIPYQSKGYMESDDEDSKKSYTNFAKKNGSSSAMRDTSSYKANEKPSIRNLYTPHKGKGEYNREKSVYFIDQSDNRDQTPVQAPLSDASDPHDRYLQKTCPTPMRKQGPDSDDEYLLEKEYEYHQAPFVEDYSLADVNIPPDRSEHTRTLYMVGQDGETRPRGCIYYSLFGNCVRGTNCPNVDGHNAEGRIRTGVYLRTKIDEIPNIPVSGSRGPVKILTRDRPGSK